ncbi:radical SAM protein, partial [Erysipelatoclostridium ramosum]
YYEESGGGVTFSGGEPLLQAAALCDTLYLLKQKQIAVCVDTAGDVAWEQLERVADYCDLFLYDIKAFDAALHKKITG